MNGAICGGYDFTARRILYCPTEGTRRRFYAWFAHYYGWTFECCELPAGSAAISAFTSSSFYSAGIRR